MPIWNRNQNKKEASKPDVVVPQNPYIKFELIDNEHLDIDMAWPLDGDMSVFVRMLTVLNNGNLISAQIAQAAIYASRVNQTDKAVAIHNALEPLMSGNRNKDKEREKDKAKPMIRASKVISTLLKGSR